MAALTAGLLGNGWPFPPGIRPESGVLQTPAFTEVLFGKQVNWTVPGGRWWSPLLLGLTAQCNGGVSPWITFELVVASGYFGTTQNPGLSGGPLFHVGFAPVALQQVHLEMGVGLGAQVMAPVDPNRLAYAAASLPQMLLGPGDQLRLVFDGGAGETFGDPPLLNVVEFEGGYAPGEQTPELEKPLPTPLLA